MTERDCASFAPPPKKSSSCSWWYLHL